jgi:surface protein
MKIIYIERPKVSSTDFITTWKTDNGGYTDYSNDHQVKLPLILSGTYDFIVDWGDGSTSHITTYDQEEITHTYAEIGTYTLHISGTLKGWSTPNFTGDSLKLLNISNWGIFNPGSGTEGSAFYGCQYMTCTATDQMDLTGVTTLAGMFYNCRCFNSDLSNWDVHNITSFFSMFASCHVFTSDLSSWNVSNSVSFVYMFLDASIFTSDLSSWDIGSCLYLTGMFEFAFAFSSDLSAWHTSQVLNMRNMFYDCAFDAHINGWDVSHVTNMSNMFGMGAMINMDISGWDVSHVTNMEQMFMNSANFNNNISGWDVSSVTNMNAMFNLCPAFARDLSGWDVSHVTKMMRMFYGATNFNCNLAAWIITNVAASVADGAYWANGMAYMFEGSGLSVANYSNTLIGWAGQAVHSDVHLGAGTIKYNATAVTDRATLTGAPNNWVITDGGLE